MKSIALTEPGNFHLEDIAEPASPTRDEVQDRGQQVGIGGMDFRAFEGKHPLFKNKMTDFSDYTASFSGGNRIFRRLVHDSTTRRIIYDGRTYQDFVYDSQ